MARDRKRKKLKQGVRKRRRQMMDKRRAMFECIEQDTVGKNSKELISRLSLFGKGVCCYCDKRVKRLTTEHLIPLTRGGTNNLRNIFGACKKCNENKENKDWRVWFRDQEFYTKERELQIKTYHEKSFIENTEGD